MNFPGEFYESDQEDQDSSSDFAGAATDQAKPSEQIVDDYVERACDAFFETALHAGISSDDLCHAYLAMTDGVPVSYAQAMASPDRRHWEEAMNKEMRSIQKAKTWDLENMPSDRKLVGGRWVLYTEWTSLKLSHQSLNSNRSEHLLHFPHLSVLQPCRRKCGWSNLKISMTVVSERHFMALNNRLENGTKLWIRS
jgi:hypothetical protein